MPTFSVREFFFSYTDCCYFNVSWSIDCEGSCLLFGMILEPFIVSIWSLEALSFRLFLLFLSSRLLDFFENVVLMTSAGPPGSWAVGFSRSSWKADSDDSDIIDWFYLLSVYLSFSFMSCLSLANICGLSPNPCAFARSFKAWLNLDYYFFFASFFRPRVFDSSCLSVLKIFRPKRLVFTSSKLLLASASLAFI